jgi:glycosyltransferase involved in cell wall biosynthesis
MTAAPFMDAVAARPRFRATIVLAVRSEATLLLRCLMTLARLPEEGSFEVIVVDNASSDETAELLGSIDGDFRAIRNEEDRGYAFACDQAAALADGEHLIFLREDAVPVDGWLDALVEALDRDPAARAARPRTVDAGGRVLEHEWVALAVRRDAFLAVGGFAGAARPGRAEKASLLEALGHVAAVPSAVVLALPEGVAG